MIQLFGINPRSAFIGACMVMTAIDQELNVQELKKFYEVLTRYGFTEDEIEREMHSARKRGVIRSGLWGAKITTSITKLDKEMQNNLVQALTEIAEADEYFHDAEKSWLTTVKEILGMPA